ncbi:hypothetical protein BO82DRAFT_163046 [Aspergillus uvarum CBS 121591]|uniref:Uncharacterized protein n=1 Tax=Aspergillus uvarum CBS 121591 TaxID=1448315 RepID=A0A319DBU8_9EURO|nr:hypothetical protein BO82DRAFT_163046 [Aspergillus uvarum CBS 121591]PYH85548.1 hypothetical protein BO82DRAFT_163046 [Aspergillus uvarum CBS 121591]
MRMVYPSSNPSQHPSVAFTSEVPLRCEMVDCFAFFLPSSFVVWHSFHFLLVLAPMTRCSAERTVCEGSMVGGR